MTHHLPDPPAPVIPPSQTVYPNKALLRTVVQIVVGLAAVMPFLVAEIGFDQTWPIIAGVLGVSAAITRIMAIPVVNMLLGKYLGLGAEPVHSELDR